MMKLFVSDLDGTLYKIGDQMAAGLSVENHLMVERFRQQGHVFAVATARTTDHVADIRKTLGFAVDVIGCNGAFLALQDQSVIKYPLQMKYYRSIDKYLRERQIDATLTATFGNERYFYSNNNCYPWNTNDAVAKERLALKIGGNTTLEEYSDQEECLKLMILIHPAVMEEVKKELRYLYGEELEIVSSDLDNIDIVQKGCSKGSAVLRLAEQYGIAKDQIYSVGDSENDIAMFQISNKSYAMSHADASVKKVSTYEVAAVYEALEAVCSE